MDSSNQRDGWTPERIDLVKRTICPKGIGTDEFLLFIEQCKRSGLDPLLKEAFCVARRQNIGNKERPNWVTKHEFQPSEAGMLARAERFPDFRGIQASAVFAEDDIVVDMGKGEVVHRFNPAKRKGALVGAWARVARNDKLPVVVWLDFSGYVQQTPLWSKIPTTMIEKCSRVAALRKAYPEAFGGLYVREEMPAEEMVDEPADRSEPPAAPAQTALPARTATRDAVIEGVVFGHEVRDPEPAPVEGERRAQSTQAPREARKEPTTKPTTSTVVAAFGPYRGKAAADLSDDELATTLDHGNEKLMEQPKARWASAMRENVEALEAEVKRRCAPTALVAHGGDYIGYDKWTGVRLSQATPEQVRECLDAMKAALASGKPVHNADVVRATTTALAKWLVDKQATPRQPALMNFGPHHGKPISSLTDAELSAVLDAGNAKAQEPNATKATWFSALKRCMTDVEAEIRVRETRKARAEPPREPGSEG